MPSSRNPTLCPLVPPVPPQPSLTPPQSFSPQVLSLPRDHQPSRPGLAARAGPGPAVKLESVSLPAPSPRCRGQLSPVANPHCNPSCPPFCRVGKFLGRRRFARVSSLLSGLQLPQRARLAGWGGQREAEFWGSFGTAGLAPCGSLPYSRFTRRAALQRLILPAANGCSCPVPSPFPPPQLLPSSCSSYCYYLYP